MADDTNTEGLDKLATAVIAVMKAVKSVEKNTTVGKGQHAYQGVSDKDVKAIVGQAMAENGLCILPIKVDPTTTINRWEQEEFWNGQSQGMKQKQSVFTEVKTQYLLLHESGQRMVLEGYGHGNDSMDKSAGKATTYALKYTLLYTFLTPTGKIDDSDNTHSDDQTIPKKTTTKKVVKKENNQVAKKEVLNEEQFKATLKGTKVQIDTVIKKYEMTDTQKAELLEARKTAPETAPKKEADKKG